jgi:hypothetical protein
VTGAEAINVLMGTGKWIRRKSWPEDHVVAHLEDFERVDEHLRELGKDLEQKGQERGVLSCVDYWQGELLYAQVELRPLADAEWKADDWEVFDFSIYAWPEDK